MKISIVIPVLNESALIIMQLQKLQSAREKGHEVIVVDGGSLDDSQQLAKTLADNVYQAKPGRSQQMNLGAAQAHNEIILFLHIDTCMPSDFADQIMQVFENPNTLWGRFDVKFTSNRGLFRVIAACMNLRSHLTGVATGDQAIFMRREVFDQLQGYACIPLMEDIELSKRLRSLSWPARIKQRAITSERRWQQNGIARTIVFMWWLRLLYFFGVKPEKIARMYYK